MSGPAPKVPLDKESASTVKTTTRDAGPSPAIGPQTLGSAKGAGNQGYLRLAPGGLTVVSPAEEVHKDFGLRLRATNTDPKDDARYLDQRIQAVGYSIWLFGFVLFVEGLDQPIFVDASMVDLSLKNAASISTKIYEDDPSARAALPYGPHREGQGLPYAYYRAAGGALSLIVPTVLSPATTPRTAEMMKGAIIDYSQYVQQELSVVAKSIVTGVLIRGVVRLAPPLATRLGAGGAAPSSLRGGTGPKVPSTNFLKSIRNFRLARALGGALKGIPEALPVTGGIGSGSGGVSAYSKPLIPKIGASSNSSQTPVPKFKFSKVAPLKSANSSKLQQTSTWAKSLAPKLSGKGSSQTISASLTEPALLNQMLAVGQRIGALANPSVSRTLQNNLEYVAMWADMGRTYEATQLLNGLIVKVEAAESSTANESVDQLYPTSEEASSEETSGHRVIDYTPSESRVSVQLDVNAPSPRDETGQRLLVHVERAIQRFEEEGLTDAQLAALRLLEREQRSAMYNAYRGSRIDEFAKQSVMDDENLQHVYVTVLKERGPDFFDSRTGWWYDITTAGAWRQHVRDYGGDNYSGFRLPTEPR